MEIKEIIVLSEDEFNSQWAITLERACYEQDACERLLLFLNHNQLTDNKNYLRLWGEYIISYKNRLNAIQDFENNIVKPHLSDPTVKIQWSYNFEDGEISIYEV